MFVTDWGGEDGEDCLPCYLKSWSIEVTWPFKATQIVTAPGYFTQYQVGAGETSIADLLPATLLSCDSQYVVDAAVQGIHSHVTFRCSACPL